MSVTPHPQTSSQAARDKRYEHMAWGLFLVMIGGLWLVPEDVIPEGTWLVGTGAIMLGLNAVRYLSAIRTSLFTIVLGIIALAIGFSDMVGVDLPVLAIMLILFGALIVYRAVRNRATG